jgi:hypothetical protein
MTIIFIQLGIHISDVPARGNVFGRLITRVLGYRVGVAHSSPHPTSQLLALSRPYTIQFTQRC